eukprot:654827-Pelagomonas_calceolata.AAC.1
MTLILHDNSIAPFLGDQSGDQPEDQPGDQPGAPGDPSFILAKNAGFEDEKMWMKGDPGFILVKDAGLEDERMRMRG